MKVAESMERNQRIAFLNPDLWLGGGTVFLLNLGGELARRGIPIEVFSLAGIHSLAGDFDRLRIPVTMQDKAGTILEERVLGTLGELKRFCPSAVIANIDPPTCEVLRYLPGGVLRIGVIHAMDQIPKARLYTQAMDILVAVSKHAHQSLAAEPGFSNLQLQCIELGVPIPSAGPRKRLSPDQPLRILYLGRLEDRAKRVRLFPAILQQLEAARIPFRWTIAGEGPERAFLESGMAREDQSVRFTGMVPYSQVPALLTEHDILLLISDTEVFPLSLQEGMAAGLVPVVSDLPGRIRELVGPRTGVLVPPANVSGYAEGIVWLHNHRDQLQLMSANAREAIRPEYSIAAMTDRWLEMLGVPPANAIIWPDDWTLLPPLFAPDSWRYSPRMRPFRRLAARARGLFKHG